MGVLHDFRGMGTVWRPRRQDACAVDAKVQGYGIDRQWRAVLCHGHTLINAGSNATATDGRRTAVDSIALVFELYYLLFLYKLLNIQYHMRFNYVF